MSEPSGRFRPSLLELMIALAVVAGLVSAVPIPRERRHFGNEVSAIGALKTIGASQAIFREGDKERDGALDFGTLTELGATQLVDSILASGTKQGYRFTASPGLESPDLTWFATANPATPRVSGDRYFATNHSGVIFYTLTGPIPVDPTTALIDTRCALPLGK